MTLIRLAWGPVSGEPRRAVADALLRELAAGAGISRVCTRCGGDHGAPLIDGGRVRGSASYVRDGRGHVIAAVVAVAPRQGISGFGIDAQAGEPEDPTGVDGVPTLRDWVRIEAAAKADGRLLRAGAARATTRGEGWVAALDGGQPIHGRDLEGPPGVVVSAAWCPT
ncbi:hypothetical protein [Microbacterium xanthum]|uniref:hypothetical protein n=1 Tax=Microbacterium xanthum TaxID=3079794 RepID=UPI002AD4496D|nr:MULTISPECIES: hypothetical protein [unclassified Microbacterium]MDZ8171917.1 hypothetical protein [Microbacterium sp. KSW-48]MDZ8199986.1 hypothetical protein [Microbacterium sp. SSW1-59]